MSGRYSEPVKKARQIVSLPMNAQFREPTFYFVEAQFDVQLRTLIAFHLMSGCLDVRKPSLGQAE